MEARARQLGIRRHVYFSLLVSNYFNRKAEDRNLMSFAGDRSSKVKRLRIQVTLPSKLRAMGHREASKRRISFSKFMECLVYADSIENSDQLSVVPVGGAAKPRISPGIVRGTQRDGDGVAGGLGDERALAAAVAKFKELSALAKSHVKLLVQSTGAMARVLADMESAVRAPGTDRPEPVAPDKFWGEVAGDMAELLRQSQGLEKILKSLEGVSARREGACGSAASVCAPDGTPAERPRAKKRDE